MRKRQRPGTARAAAADRMKLHRRSLWLAGREYTVIGPRPGTAVRYSTNRFHETWHILSDQHGARVLSRLLWGLSYQARPGTILLIDRPFITGTPFDADPGDPIVIVPGWTTPFGPKAAAELRRRLPLSAPPEGTVRWHTFGLDAASADPNAWWDAQPSRMYQWWRRDSAADPLGGAERHGNLLVVTCPTAWRARSWAVGTAWVSLADRDMDYDYLDWPKNELEVQIFADFHRSVRAARVARREVSAHSSAADPRELREAVWAWRD